MSSGPSALIIGIAVCLNFGKSGNHQSSRSTIAFDRSSRSYPSSTRPIWNRFNNNMATTTSTLTDDPFLLYRNLDVSGNIIAKPAVMQSSILTESATLLLLLGGGQSSAGKDARLNALILQPVHSQNNLTIWYTIDVNQIGWTDWWNATTRTACYISERFRSIF